MHAVAFAVELILGQDPTKQSFDREKLRQHFISMLELKTVTEFPDVHFQVSCTTQQTLDLS